MAALGIAERFKIRTLAAEQTRRRIVTRALSSPLMRWRYGGSAADQILIVPQELRPADPSFWNEIENGHFGLASEIAALKGASPFRILPPSPAWERELHGFGWLRHLAAAESEDAVDGARQLVLDWIDIYRSPRGIAFEPDVMARRLISWISQATLLLEGIEAKSYTAIMSSIGQQVVALKANWRNAPTGAPRLTSLIALVLADLAISGHDRQLKEAKAALEQELSRQILGDGGHVSRNASVLADLVLDLLPLGQCFLARGQQPPAQIADVVKRALAFLRFMRLGDGMLARFNGVSTGSPAGLATVLGYSGGDLEAASAASDSGYVRLERGETIIIADTGSPPPMALASEAEAGALSFEMTARARLLFVNGGFPGPADSNWASVARATASHNTLCLNETSSSRLVQNDQLQSLVGGTPIQGPDFVAARLSDEGGVAVLAASHDGYLKRYGLMHSRRILLAGGGDRVDGFDRLEPPQGKLRLKADLPFAIHFHIHPDARVKMVRETGHAKITLSDGQIWVFQSDGANLSLEDSLYFVDSAGPRPGFQLVVRGATYGEAEVRWSVAREAGT